MARNNFKRGSVRNRANKNNFFNISFLSGLFFGFFLSFAIYTWKDQINFSLENTKNSTVNGAGPVELPKSLASKKTEKNSPTFYKFLSTEKVPLPQSVLKEQKDNTIPEIGSDKFYLQIGSFKNLSDADARKARLALLGIITRIEETANREGGKWYRVQLGPVSRISARDLRSKISKEGFEVLVMKN